MKNKIGYGKTLTISIIIAIIFILTNVIINCVAYRTYTKNFNAKIDLIIGETIKENPDTDKDTLIKILNNENNKSDDVLKKYGINLNEDSAILENDKRFYEFTLLSTAITVIFILVVLIVFAEYNRRRNKKIKQITDYIEQINQKNYKLDIEENSEGELSRLKNEIYKTTVMLNEIADNETKDKENLKESLSDISHQLKTPLTSIIIILDNILDNPDMEQTVREDFIKDIKREITNIQFLVANLLKLSKLDANSVQFINKEVKVEEIIQNVVKNVSSICDLKNIKINITGDSKAKIVCDERWQIEAITNIVKNAAEHSKTDSEIDISYEQNKAYTKVVIKDYGAGISNSDIKHIFQRFYKSKNSAKDSIGIGLPLAKSIIERNNGYIEVTSEEGKGTTFTIKYLK